MQGALGVFALLALAWAFSENRRAVRPLPAIIGVALQFALAAALLRAPIVKDGLLLLNHVVSAIEIATTAGASLVFGFLGGAETPFALTADNAPYIFAFRILPQVLVFSALVALLWHWRVLPAVIRCFAWALERSLGVGGAVGVAASASVFLGMVEAPLAIRAYLAHLSRSELFVVMTCGMSTVAGSIMVLYASVLAPVIDGALGHIVVGSVVNVLGAVVIARIMVPESRSAASQGLVDALQYDSAIDAIYRGTADGMRLVVNIGAMVLVMVSLIALANHLLGAIHAFGAPLALERAVGWAFAPVAWLMGVDWAEAPLAGALLGVKLVLNELIAYIQLGGMEPAQVSERTRLILAYGLCGFANFGSLGILIGGLSALVPARRSELLSLAPKAVISGTIVGWLTGTIAGLATL